MTKVSQISAGQLTALLLTGRLAVSMSFAPTVHQVSNGTDFFLSALLHGILILLCIWLRDTGGRPRGLNCIFRCSDRHYRHRFGAPSRNGVDPFSTVFI